MRKLLPLLLLLLASPASAARLGNQAAQNYVGTGQNNKNIAIKVTTSAGGPFAAGDCRANLLAGAGTSQFVCEIWSDSAGNPGTKLCSSSAQTFTAETWNTVSMLGAGCGNLTGSTDYWVGINLNASDINPVRANSGISAYYSAADTFPGSTSSFGSASNSGLAYSITLDEATPPTVTPTSPPPTATHTPTVTASFTPTPPVQAQSAQVFFGGPAVTAVATRNISLLTGDAGGDWTVKVVAWPAVTAGHIKNLYVQCNPAITNTQRFTVYKNGSPTSPAVTCDVTASRRCDDVTHGFDYDALDEISFVTTNISGGGASQCAGSVEVTNYGDTPGHTKIITSGAYGQSFSDAAPGLCYFAPGGVQPGGQSGATDSTARCRPTKSEREFVMPTSGTWTGFAVRYKDAVGSGSADWTLENLTNATDVGLAVTIGASDQKKVDIVCDSNCTFSAGDRFVVRVHQTGGTGGGSTSFSLEYTADTQALFTNFYGTNTAQIESVGTGASTAASEVPIPNGKQINKIYGTAGATLSGGTLYACTGTPGNDTVCTGSRPACAFSTSSTCSDTSQIISLSAGDVINFQKNGNTAFNANNVFFSLDIGDPPTPTPTQSESPTPSQTFTPSNTRTPTVTATPSLTPTESPTPTLSATFTATNTPTHTATSTPTFTPTLTGTPTRTPTRTPTDIPTWTPTFSPTETPTFTPTPTMTATFRHCKTITPTPGACGGAIVNDIRSSTPTGMWVFAELTPTVVAEDIAGDNDGTYSGNRILYGPGEPGMIVSGSGQMVTSTPYPAPQKMTLLMGFRGTTGTFAQWAPQDPNAKAYALLEVSPAGTAWWGIEYGTGQKQLAPPQDPFWQPEPYVADGSDHVLVGSIGPEGQRMYLDGKLIDTKPMKHWAAPTPGVWTFGYGNTFGWPNITANGYTGDIQCAAWWNDRQLNPTAVMAFMPSPTGTETPTPTVTKTATLTPTITGTPTKTNTPTLTRTPSRTPTPTLTVTLTPTRTFTPAIPSATPAPTVCATIGIASGTNVGRCESQVVSSYPPPSVGSCLTDVDAWVDRSKQGSNYTISNGFMRWNDTGALVGQTILSATTTLCLNGAQHDTSPSRSLACEYIPNWTDPLDASNYTTGSVATAINIALDGLSVPGPTPCVDNVLTLVNPDASMTKGGFTALRCTISGAAPVGAPNDNNDAYINGSQTPVPAARPRLNVCYVPYTPSPTITPSPTPTETPTQTPTRTPTETPTQSPSPIPT